MRILYVIYFSVFDKRETGVLKKVRNQINALIDLKNDVDLCSLEENHVLLQSYGEKRRYNTKKSFNIRKRIWCAVKRISKDQHYDAVYIRLPGFIDSSFRRTIKLFKRNGTKVLLEIPTYPIKGELENNLKYYVKRGKIFGLLIRVFLYCMHGVYAKFAHRYIDKIVTFMPYEKIWNIEVIYIDNGVNTEECHAVQKTIHEGINLIVVANIAKWHGIDRLILGLKDYYNHQDYKEKVYFLIIGETELVDELKQYSKELGVFDYCRFLGRKEGEALYLEYCKADIAVGSLGMHRINVMDGSTIKIKEYCSLGIPFIYAYNEREIDDNFKYALKLKADESAINIFQIIDFFKDLEMDEKKSIEMHEFAERRFSWKKQMKYVLENIKDE